MDECKYCKESLISCDFIKGKCPWCGKEIEDDPRSQYTGDEMDLYYD